MAKLYFNYSTMNAGKTTVLLQAAHNYAERGMTTYLLNADFDTRSGEGKVSARIGLSAPADTYSTTDDLFDKVVARMATAEIACVFVDEAQWLTREQVWQLAKVVDNLNVPVMCYGLRTDFMGELFPGSSALLAIADNLREIRTICHCGRKATMVVRLDANGKAQTAGAQIEVGGNDKYVTYCRKHWTEATELT
jgi:thymidine kinase